MNYLKAIPYVIALAIIAGVLRFAYVSGYNASETKWSEKYALELGSLNDQLVKSKRELLEAVAKQSEIEATLLEKHREQAANAQTIIDNLNAGNVRLRQSLTIKACPSVPKSTAGTGSSDADSTGGLSKEDVEFLIREASRADQYAEQLIAAQQVITRDRVVCP